MVLIVFDRSSHKIRLPASRKIRMMCKYYFLEKWELVGEHKVFGAELGAFGAGLGIPEEVLEVMQHKKQAAYEDWHVLVVQELACA